MKCKQLFTADFETTTKNPLEDIENADTIDYENINPVHVWAWGISSIQNPEKCYFGTTIDTFFQVCTKLKNPRIYFHNLKFDGSYILHWLLTNGFVWRQKSVECIGKDFTTIISDDGKFYAIEVYFQRTEKHSQKATFYDSLKLLNMPVREVAKSFDLPIKKGKIDYNRHNTPCEVTKEEWEYLKNDVQIMSMALSEMFSSNLTKMTIGSCALSDYKNDLGKKFNYLFPQLSYEVDSEIRKSYKGGFTYANPLHVNEDIGFGVVYDVNSLYPSVMAYRPLPYGQPLKFEGEYVKNTEYPLFIQNLRCFFELKENHIPTIQLKNSKFFAKTQYLTSSKNKVTGEHEYVELCLTSPDLELFFKHYNVFCIEYTGGYMFKSSTTLFKKWVDKWTAEKIAADLSGNTGKRKIAKLILNNLYGKFALNPNVQSKQPYFDSETQTVKYKLIEYICTDENGDIIIDNSTGEPLTTTKAIREPIYIPVGTFVTAWARYTTITASQAIHEDSLNKTGISRYLYSDTDSIHLMGFDSPECIEVHPTELGKWKLESHFERARFIQAKRYIEDEIITIGKDKHLLKNSYGDFQTYLKITCAGLPENCYKSVTWDNFHLGTTYNGKLTPKVVQGGIILQETTFTLK